LLETDLYLRNEKVWEMPGMLMVISGLDG
jgi:hypothetical protein